MYRLDYFFHRTERRSRDRLDAGRIRECSKLSQLERAAQISGLELLFGQESKQKLQSIETGVSFLGYSIAIDPDKPDSDILAGSPWGTNSDSSVLAGSAKLFEPPKLASIKDRRTFYGEQVNPIYVLN